MKKYLSALVLSALLFGACSKSKTEQSVYPANFKQIGDAARVDFVIAHSSPDSVARFIIFGALGRNPEAPVDSLPLATTHAYEVLKGDAIDRFAIVYDSLVNAQPLPEKMKLYKLGAGSEDSQKLGYMLGLDYMNSIRDHSMSVKQVEEELKEFRKVCGSDTATYRRFLIGFKTVLKADHDLDVPEDIYRNFINYE